MKFISLLSSGIDSPVATYLISKKADELLVVHADNQPFTDDRETKNFIALVKHLKKQISCPITACIVPHGNALSCFTKQCTNRFTCVFCKRMLLRYAEHIAKKQQADALIMGDSLGQVASQTLQNISVIDQAISVPILRPLIGFDKEDVIKIAKKIQTYDLSILPSDSCSAVPLRPATQAKLEQIIAEEEKIDVESLVHDAITKARLLSF